MSSTTTLVALQDSFRYQSANFDFCEPNFTIFPGIAEFFNCVSCIFMVYSGLYHWPLVVHTKGDASAGVLAAPVVFLRILSFLYVIVGIGSAWFHGSLSRAGQVSDELPMVLLVSAMHAATSVCSTCGEDGFNASGMWTALAAAWGFGILLYFLCDFVYFILLYALLVALLVLRFSSRFSFSTFSSMEPVTLKDSEQLERYKRHLSTRAMIIYVGGAAILWAPMEFLLCNAYLQNFWVLAYSLHALFHLTSSQGPAYCLQVWRLMAQEAVRRKTTARIIFLGERLFATVSTQGYMLLIVPVGLPSILDGMKQE